MFDILIHTTFNKPFNTINASVIFRIFSKMIYEVIV